MWPGVAATIAGPDTLAWPLAMSLAPDPGALARACLAWAALALILVGGLRFRSWWPPLNPEVL